MTFNKNRKHLVTIVHEYDLYDCLEAIETQITLNLELTEGNSSYIKDLVCPPTTYLLTLLFIASHTSLSDVQNLLQLFRIIGNRTILFNLNFNEYRPYSTL